MIGLLLLSIACVNAASVRDACSVGSWSDWSECTPSKHCPKVPTPVFSYPMEETSEWDYGRTQMQYVMKEKAKSWAEMDRCIADGTCPEKLARPIAGPFVCDATGVAGDIPCKNVDQLGFLTFEDMGYFANPNDTNPRGNDVWGWVDPLNNDEYAIMGFTGGTAFVRVTDPRNPVPVGFIPTATVPSSWRDIKVIGNYAYIVSEAGNHGLQVFDLTHLRGQNSIRYFQPDAVNNDFGQAHNIVSNEDTNFVYVVGVTNANGYPRICAGGLLVIDVSDPLNPTYAGCFGGDGYVHDAQCVIYHGPDVAYQGREVCFCFNEDSLTLVDVQDKQNMFMIAKSGYINAAYTHQGWVTEDHALILLDDELDESRAPASDKYTKTYVWDISALTNPVLRYVFSSSETSIDHNQYIIGDYSYQANYESGLRILHIDRATNILTNVGYFDVLPATTNVNFAGAWSVYPYFNNGRGTVLVSSIDYGLFIVQPNWEAIDSLVQSRTTYAEQTRSRPITAAVQGATCPKTSETKSCTAPVLC